MALADPKKAKVIHILSDGTVLDSIEGHIVRLDNPEPLLRVFLSVSEKMAQKKAKERMVNHDENERTA